jgi:hypothetical protein
MNGAAIGESQPRRFFAFRYKDAAKGGISKVPSERPLRLGTVGQGKPAKAGTPNAR